MSNISKPLNIGLSVTTIGLAGLFGLWMSYMERQGRRPLIPNSLWRNRAFATVCFMVLIDWAVLNSMEYFYVLL